MYTYTHISNHAQMRLQFSSLWMRNLGLGLYLLSCCVFVRGWEGDNEINGSRA